MRGHTQDKFIQSLEQSVKEMNWEINKLQDSMNLQIYHFERRQKKIKDRMDKVQEEIRFHKAVLTENLKYA